MLKKKIILFAIVLSVFLFIGQLVASEVLEMNNFKDIGQKITNLGLKYGDASVLVVLDADYTLLTAADDFGGDVWWDWQYELLKNRPNSPYLVGKNVDQIVFYETIIQSFVKNYPTEKKIPMIIERFQGEGVKTIVLTGRYPDTRNLLERQLSKVGFDFGKYSFSHGFPGEYLPYDIKAPEKYGLTSEDVKEFNLNPPKGISFFNGIAMTADGNKGVILKTLLFKTGKKFKAIVFVDDNKRNVDDVYNVFKNNSTVDIVSIRYSYDDAIKRQFQESNKSNVIRQWKELKATLDSVFGE